MYSQLTICSIIWFYELNTSNKKKLNKIIKQASKITGTDVKQLECLCNDMLSKKLQCIMSDVTHPVHDAITVSKSGRLIQPKSKTNRFNNSFIPSAVRLFNVQFNR